MVPKYHFIGLKNPQHQQQEFMCTPACIKTILDNQFNLQHKISQKTITDTICDKIPLYNRWIPKGVDEIKSSLINVLKDHVIGIEEEINVSKDRLLKLISSDIYPMVFLELDEYYKYREVKVKETYGDFLSHCVIVVGYDENKEIFGLWDPLDPHEKKSYVFNDVRKIDYKIFLRCWDKAKSRIIYLYEKSKQKKLSSFEIFR